MYDKWRRDTQQNGQTEKEFGAYLQSIQVNLFKLDEVSTLNKTQLIYWMWQGLKSEHQAALYQNLTISKNLPAFFKAIA